MPAFAGMTKRGCGHDKSYVILAPHQVRGEDLLFIYNDHLALAADLQNVTARNGYAKP